MQRVCQIFGQGKGKIFDRMLELKRTINDPQKIDTDASRALDLAFDHKDIVNLTALKEEEPQGTGTGSGIESNTGTKKAPVRDRLKINSEQMISLEEKNQFESEASQSAAAVNQQLQREDKEEALDIVEVNEDLLEV